MDFAVQSYQWSLRYVWAKCTAEWTVGNCRWCTIYSIGYLFVGIHQWNIITGYSRFSIGHTEDSWLHGHSDIIFIGHISRLAPIGNVHFHRTNTTIHYCDLHTRNAKLFSVKWARWRGLQVNWLHCTKYRNAINNWLIWMQPQIIAMATWSKQKHWIGIRDDPVKYSSSSTAPKSIPHSSHRQPADDGLDANHLHEYQIGT